MGLSPTLDGISHSDFSTMVSELLVDESIRWKRSSYLYQYLYSAGPVTTLNAPERERVLNVSRILVTRMYRAETKPSTESAHTVASSRLFQSLTVLMNKELIYCTVFDCSTMKDLVFLD